MVLGPLVLQEMSCFQCYSVGCWSRLCYCVQPVSPAVIVRLCASIGGSVRHGHFVPYWTGHTAGRQWYPTFSRLERLHNSPMRRYRQGLPLSRGPLAVHTPGPTAERGRGMGHFLEIFILNSVLEWFFACRCRRICRAHPAKRSLFSHHDFTAFHVPGPA
jgi:hypothetical protein